MASPRLRIYVRCEGHQFLTLANGEDNFLQLQDVIESQVAQLYHVQTEIDRLSIDGYDIFPEFTVRDVLSDECVVMVVTKEAAASKKRRYSINNEDSSPNPPPPTKKAKSSGDTSGPSDTKVDSAIDEEDNSVRRRSRTARKPAKKLEDDDASEKEMFSCPYCSRESTTKGGLTRHIHHAHPGEVIPSHITRKQ
eukprot:TRINITY_DN4957_c0_g2_i1.p1 TRINITY_DN4957_c0_g2~~TRINITY_DN4957_c0_g2_i1.p1  ORF type:complete len:204 (+),score=34.19 TRINITY_DN4957_c0_g2_i1:33-614(+)